VRVGRVKERRFQKKLRDGVGEELGTHDMLSLILKRQNDNIGTVVDD